ncbi:class III chitinase ChiA2 [Penicillium malachiteum]|uniref:class III chitinase ChiA2 n=1 Tax=Penicillium malachiteum TaxID=1324776 RepID=UPI0025494D82|nr:class III chitinase ChiA2 [Penicillium malachiteum]KAJ5715958.1 class III chitinase ChiA2 [Penicillium malachiteum]
MMYLSFPLAALGLLTTVVFAMPYSQVRRDEGHQNVVYWGQNGGEVIENNDLASYCNSQSGIDIIVLAFLYEYGNGQRISSGGFGQSCFITPSGEGQNCEELGRAITTCQNRGIKVIMSLGGAVGAYGLTSQQEAEAIGSNIWAAYGNSGYSGVPRPFGNAFVNGWDFDIEASSGNQYYRYLISTLRSKFSSDPAHRYYISGAPQCPIPEPFMQPIIDTSQFDYLWVQFYNNPDCSLPHPNFDDWVRNIGNTPSSGAKIFLGIPASPYASTGTLSGERYYMSPSSLADVVRRFSGNNAFGGIMMWSAGFSDSNMNNGCTYAQETKHILTTGSPC